MFSLINELDTLYETAVAYIKEHRHLNEHYTVSKHVPNLLVTKIKSLVEKNKAIFESEQDVRDFIKIACNQFETTKNLNVKAKERLAEAIMQSQMSNDYSFDVNNEDTRDQIKQHAANIMRVHRCDVYSAIAYAMKDCEPTQCDLPENAKEHVEEHFSPEDVEEVKNLAMQVTEWFKGCEDEEVASVDAEEEEETVKDEKEEKEESKKEKTVKSKKVKKVKESVENELSPEQKRRLIGYAKRDRKRSGRDARDILADMLENIAGMEDVSVDDVFTQAEIDSVQTCC